MQIKLEIHNIKAIKKNFDADVIKKAQRQAFKDSIPTVKREMRSYLQDRFTVKSKYLAKNITYSPLQPAGILITLVGRPLQVVAFKIKQLPKQKIRKTGRKLPRTARGVAMQVRKSDPFKTVPGAFKATMKSGHKGVFKRIPKYSPMQVLKKEKIGEQRTAPSVATLYTSAGSMFKLTSSVQKKFKERFYHHLAYYQGKKG